MRGAWWVLVLCAGCVETAEDVMSSNVEAPIRVTVYQYSTDPSVPLAGAEVRFVAPDGTTQSTTTDESGVAEAASPAGTTVIVFQMAEYKQRFVKVFYETAPGDDIIAGRMLRQAFPPLADVTLVSPKRGGAGGYVYIASCNGNNGVEDPVHVAHISACASAPDATVVAWAVDANGQPFTSASLLRHVDLTAVAGTTVKLPAYQHKAVPVTAQLSNFPGGSTNISWGIANRYGLDPTVFAGANGPALEGANQMSIFDVGDRSQHYVQFTPPGYDDVRYELYASTRVDSFAFDASATVRPAHGATFDATTQTLTWNVAPYGRPGTITNFTLIAHDYNGKDVRIDLHTPTDPTTVTLPALPPELTPQPTDVLYLSGFTTLLEGSSYRQLMPVVDTAAGYGADYSSFRGEFWRATIR